MAAAAILGAVASLVGPAIEIGKCFQKQLNYLCCFQSNVKALDDADKSLADKKADLQARVDEAKRNGKPISSQAETWLAKAGETQQVMTLGIGTTQKPGIFNLKSRYSLSKKAIKTAQSMNHLRDTCDLDHVSNPPLPAAMGRPQIPPAPGGWIESRKKIEDDIIIAMIERNVHVIGVCGMGGVGKTTMAKQIMNRAKELDEALFDEVLLVVVGQQVDMLKIQHGIADWLGLKFEEETLAPRAIRLRDRLLGENRKLIVIDDVWERINLEDLGIPCESRLCTILLTSRDRGVLHQMNAQRVFTVQILSDEEAWSMFQEKVELPCLEDDPNLLPTARDVVKECKGLPLALVAVSRALKGQADKRIWSDALNQLQRNNPEDIPGFIKEVYNPIKFSFDLLESSHAKSLLFLCSSFPDDHEISLEHLALYGFGLGILGDINNLEEARNKIARLVDILKSRFLLLDCWNEHLVRMHDVVRDVANFIAKQENIHAILDSISLDRSKLNPHINDCSMLSVFQNQSRFDFPMGLILPNLSYLWVYNPDYKSAFHPLSDNIFKGMQQLKVLSITRFSFGLTPQNMRSLENHRLLENLRTLHLYMCHLETLSAVGELSCLEILCCEACRLITELPVEIGRLHRLRLLEVTDCDNLKTIVPGVISRLGQLEELKMVDSFTGWESKEIENERCNASLAELHSLSKLTCLEIQIVDWSLDAQVLQLSLKIVKYNIRVGGSLLQQTYSTRSHEKKLSFSLQMCPSLVNWIAVFARTVEHLCINGFDSNGYDFSGHQNLKCLEFRNCQTVVKLVRSASTDWGIGVFPVLEELYLSYLPKLEEICHDPIPYGSKSQDILLPNLSHLMILGCRKLRRVFSSAVVIRSLSQLRSLEIKECESMEEVFWIEKDDGNSPSSCITFPKLETLRLERLGSLTYFITGIDVIEFPRLFGLDIKQCRKLHRVFSSSLVIRSLSQLRSLRIYNCESMEEVFLIEKDDGNSPSSCITFPKLETLRLMSLGSLTYFCKGIDIIEFPQLVRLEIENCPKLHRVFSSSVVIRSLSQLRSLEIKECESMEEVFWIEKDGGNSASCITFPRLETLSLKGLGSMAYFCKGIDIIEFPQLVSLEIVDCPKLTSLSKASDHQNHVSSSGGHDSIHILCNTKSTFGNLEVLHIEECVNMNNLFSYSVALSLVNLKTLYIKRCSEMVYAIANDDAEISKTKPQQIIFHKLEWLNLYDLPKLQNFCEGRWDIQLPLLNVLYIKNVGFYSARENLHLLDNTQITFDNLRDLHIQGCLGDGDHIKNLFSYSVAGNLVNLKTLSVSHFSEMIYVIADIGDYIAKTSGNNPQIIFHKLEKLRLHDLPKLQNFCEGRWDIQLPSLKKLFIDNVGFYSARECVQMFCNTQSTFLSLHPFFSNLEELTIHNCDNMNNLFSYSVAAHLVNLKTLDINVCNEMAYVVTEDDAPETSQTKPQQIIFHKLEVLNLHDLPKFQNFCEGRWDIQLPSLKKLHITKVGFYSARECVPLFYNTQITFDKLTRLEIQGYLGDRDHIKHLFSYSVAGNLVNLETLRISNFSEMVYVIADDDEDIAKTSEERPQTIFCKLHRVELSNLPKLQSVCDWAWDVQFPSLKVLNIIDCPGMEDVTLEAVESRRPARQRHYKKYEPKSSCPPTPSDVQESDVDKTLITGAVDLSKFHLEVPPTFLGLRVLQEDPIPIPIPIPIPPAEESLALVPLNQNSNR